MVLLAFARSTTKKLLEMKPFFMVPRWAYRSNGDEVSYTNWDPSQPNGASQDCVSVNYPNMAENKWVDEECKDLKQFVCEFAL